MTADARRPVPQSRQTPLYQGWLGGISLEPALPTASGAGFDRAGLPPDAITGGRHHNRAAVDLMVAMPESIDVIIPRGGRA